MEITPELIATGGVLGALVIAVLRILQGDAPLGRAVMTAERREAEAERREANAEREVERLRQENQQLRDQIYVLERDLAVARAIDAFHSKGDAGGTEETSDEG